MDNIKNLIFFGYPQGVAESIIESIVEFFRHKPASDPVEEEPEPAVVVEEPVEATPSEPDAEFVDKVIALRKQGQSFLSIARELDVEIKTVVNIVKLNNLN